MPRNKKVLYDTNERQKIVDHIIQNNLYFNLRSRCVWQEMEKLEICPGRTWQSMKQHFQMNIVYSLDSLNINESEKNRILNSYHNNYKCIPVKRKELSSTSTETDNNPKAPKKCKVQSLPFKFVDQRSPEVKEEINNSQDNCNRTTHENINNGKMEIEQNRNIGEKMMDKLNNLSFTNDDNGKDVCRTEVDSSTEDSYTEKEDLSIIIYIQENMNWTNLHYFDDIYNDCQRDVLINRSATSIKNRFINFILPNIYKYRIVNIDEIPLFYDRACVDMPTNFEQIFEECMINNGRSSVESISTSSTKSYENSNIQNIPLNENIQNSAMRNSEIVSGNNEPNCDKSSSKMLHEESNKDVLLRDNEKQLQTNKNTHSPIQKSIMRNSEIVSGNNKLNYVKSFSKMLHEESNNDALFHHNKKIDVQLQKNKNTNSLIQKSVMRNSETVSGNNKLSYVKNSSKMLHEESNKDACLHHNEKNDIQIQTNTDFKSQAEFLPGELLNVRPLNFKKIETLQSDCSCELLRSVKNKSRVVHLPINVKHIKTNKYLEKICKCCTEVKSSMRKKSNKENNCRKLDAPEKNNELESTANCKKNGKSADTSSNDNELSSPTNYMEEADLSKNVFCKNIDDIEAEIEIGSISNHSSPEELYNKPTSDGNILVNGHLNSIKSRSCSPSIRLCNDFTKEDCEEVCEKLNVPNNCVEDNVKEVPNPENKIDDAEDISFIANLPKLPENLKEQSILLNKVDYWDNNSLIMNAENNNSSLSLYDLNSNKGGLLPKLTSRLVNEEIDYNVEENNFEPYSPNLIQKSNASNSEELITVKDELIIKNEVDGEGCDFTVRWNEILDKIINVECLHEELQIKVEDENLSENFIDDVIENVNNCNSIFINETLSYRTQNCLEEETELFKEEPFEEYEPKLFETEFPYSPVENSVEIKMEEEEIDINILFPDTEILMQIKQEEDPLNTDNYEEENDVKIKIEDGDVSQVKMEEISISYDHSYVSVFKNNTRKTYKNKMFSSEKSKKLLEEENVKYTNFLHSNVLSSCHISTNSLVNIDLDVDTSINDVTLSLDYEFSDMIYYMMLEY